MAKGRDGSAPQNPAPTPVNFTSPDNALRSRLQGPTYFNMEPLSMEDNPYEQVAQGYGMNGKFDDSPDGKEEDNIYTDVGPSRDDPGRQYENTGQHLAPRTQILREFEEYLEAQGPFSDAEERRLRDMDLEDKWSVVNQQGKSPIFSATYYADGLRQHTNGAKKSRPSFGKSRGGKDVTGSLASLLKKLKLDLRMSHDRFVEEFVRPPNRGLELLLAVLKDIQKDASAATNSVKKTKQDHYKQALMDEYYCLLCIKFTARVEEGLQALVKTSGALETIAPCLMNEQRKTSLVTVQILTIACSAPNGQQQVLDTMSFLRLKLGESVRFKLLMGMLNSPTSHQFQAACVHFFNTLWTCTDNVNAKVYLQHELQLAGFDPDTLDRNAVSAAPSPEADELRTEVEIWRRNYIEVSGSRQKVIELESRNTQLREEVDRLQIRIQTAEKDNGRLQQTQAGWKDKSDKYRERAAELQDVITKLTNLYRERTGLDPEEEVNLEEAIRSLDVYGTVRGFGESAQRPPLSDSAYNLAEPPPMPPAPPPPDFLSRTVRNKVTPQVNLPLFNWTPLPRIQGTMFENLDDEAMLRDLDFTPFEEQFQLPARTEGQKSREKRERAINKLQSQIHFVEVNRAKNMIITKTRIAKGVQHRLFWEDPLSSRDIKDAIEKCDLVILPGEYAELLLKYVPTKDEVKKLAENAQRYAAMGEAEQLLFQLAQVERLESKLSMMAFIGIFDEMLATMRPQIDCVHQASLSVLNCIKLRKLFEIILAYGNYMNSSKRGYSLGFRLESLAKLKDVKSFNREITMMHHLADIIESRYPELTNFYNDLHIKVDKGVSYQAMASDVLGLRKGIDLIKFEMEKQPKNTTIQRFHTQASTEIARIAEAFHKMEDAFTKVCAMFGETIKVTEPDEFFGHISAFVADFKEASKDNYKRTHPHESITPLSSPRTLEYPKPSVASSFKSPTDKTPPKTLEKPDFMGEASTLMRSTEKQRLPLITSTSSDNVKSGPSSPMPLVEQNGELKVPQSQSKTYSAAPQGNGEGESLYAKVRRPSASTQGQDNTRNQDGRSEKKAENAPVVRRVSQRKLPRTPAESVKPDKPANRPTSFQRDRDDLLYESIEEMQPNITQPGPKVSKVNVSNGHVVYENLEGGQKKVPLNSPITPEYKKQVDKALNSLDQVLDDAMNDGILAMQSEDSRL